MHTRRRTNQSAGVPVAAYRAIGPSLLCERMRQSNAYRDRRPTPYGRQSPSALEAAVDPPLSGVAAGE
jgi:hypothetical protein